MIGLQETQSRACKALSYAIVNSHLTAPDPVDPSLLESAVNALAQYTLELALARLHAGGCGATAERLADILLGKQNDFPTPA